MNKKVLDYINRCEGWKTAIKSLHWDSNSLSQHELCDDIAESIAEFQDTVSEVEQSITGKLKVNSLNPTEYKIKNLKAFVEDVLDATNTFYKEVKDMGDTYVGMASDCESFLSDMQRKLYLVNFTMKEDFKREFREKLNESMPKNLAKHDEVDKFVGRRPKTMKARINQIYRIVKRYGIDSKVYHDENWQAISDYYRAISSLGCEVEMKPCGHIENIDSIESDGGYCDYAEDGMPRSKQYAVKIMFEDGMNIDGYIKCMAAGTMEDPFSSYDTCMVLWPKSNRMLENKDMKKEIKLTEGELKTLVKEAATKILSETPLNYDIDNFSGRWTKSEPSDDELALADSAANGDYLDDPFHAPNNWDDDEWIDGDKDMENDYSWDRFENKPMAPGLDNSYLAGKRSIPRDIDSAIAQRNRKNNWSDGELRHGRRMMDKWVNGQRDNEDLEDGWDDIQYTHRFEGKEPVKVTEEELKQLVREASMQIINEYNNKMAKVNRFVRSTHGNRNGKKREATPEERAEARRRLGIKEPEKTEEESIEIKPENKGKFNATKERTGKSTEELTHSKNKKTKMRAVFAQNAADWNHKGNKK